MFSVGGTVMEKNNFSLLRSKEIIAILDGDKDFGELTFEDKYGRNKNKNSDAVFKRASYLRAFVFLWVASNLLMVWRSVEPLAIL